MSFSSTVKEEILKEFKKKFNIEFIQAEKFGEYLTECKSKKDLESIGHDEKNFYNYDEFFEFANLDENIIKSILKGVFLGSGCIVDPSNDYHFEALFKSKACAMYVFNLLSLLEFTPGIMKRKQSTSLYIVYLKGSDQISEILSMLGANLSKLKFEQIRVEKEVKNNINRTNNCEVANMAKTIKTSMIQIEAIEKLKKYNLFDNLNEKLKYTASLRLKYKDESLDSISKKTIGKDYVSKSGLKHRLDKLVELANNIEK